MKTGRVSLARWMSLTLAVLCLATQFTSFAHLALVPHATCAAHGELVEPGVVQPPSTVRRRERDASSSDVATAEWHLAEAGHAHDHCILTATRRTPADLDRACAPSELGPPVANDARAVRDPQVTEPVIALLDVAPKSSPPPA